MKSQKIKIGILGCGAVAYRWYLKGLCVDHDKYEVVVLCDSVKGRAAKAAKKFNIDHSCSSIKNMLKYDPDLVVVLTRHLDHFEHIKYFLNNGVHVYSEKPFASNTTEGKILIELAKKNSLKLASAPQVMLSSRNIKVKQLIADGLIGKLTLVRASCSNLGPAGRSDTDYDPEWFYNEGGSLASLGIYGLSALLWIIGFPKKIVSFQGISYEDRKVMFGPAKGKQIKVTAPDNVVALMDFGKAIYALFDGSYSVVTPPKYDFEFHGTKGSLLVGGFGGTSSILHCDLNKECREIGPDDECHLRWNLSWGVEDLVIAIIEKRDPVLSAEFALKIISVMGQMKRSSDKELVINATDPF